MKHFGIPGPGGSLGMCAVCGKNFMPEILMGKQVESFSCAGIEGVLYAHKSCRDALELCGKDWTRLPEGPLRTVFVETYGEPAAVAGVWE